MFELIADMWSDGWVGRLLLGLIVLTVCGILALPFAIYAIVQEDKRWEKFAREHHCVKVDERTTSTLMPLMVGKTVMLLPQSTTETLWRCDDGKEYWR